MIRIEIKKTKSGEYRGFTVKGHADYAESGSDIVCSAVSMLVINTINSIEHFTDDKFNVKSDEEKGLIDFEFVSETVSSRSVLLLDSMVLGLESAVKQYGNFVSIR